MSMTGVKGRPSAASGSDINVAHVPTQLTPTPDQATHWMKAHRTLIASSTSSVFSTLSAFPLDSIKTRMQAYGPSNPIRSSKTPGLTDGSYRYKHVGDCVTHTYKTEGVKGFWRGALAPIFSVTLVRTASFSIYQSAKYKYSAAIGKATGGDEPLVVVNRPGSTPTLATIACFGAAGGTAGALITALACPFELTKMSAQISTLMANRNHSSMEDPVLKNSYTQKGTFKTAKNIVVNRGFAGMYSGFSLHLLRDTIGTTIYFTTYESTKQMLVKIQKSKSPTSPLSVALAGGFCGLVSWACIYPIDTAKTHYQRNCLSVARGQPVKLPKIEFFNRKMYSGIGVSMTRSCLINTIFFSSFEFIKKEINILPNPVKAMDAVE